MTAFLKFSLFILGIIVMYACFTAEHALSREVQDIFALQSLGIERFATLKGTAIPLATILFGLVLLFFTWNANINRAFTWFLPLYILLWLGTALGFHYNLFENNITLSSIVYVLQKAMAPLLAVLIMGYANQMLSFRTAAIFYPLLGILGIYIAYQVSAHYMEQVAKLEMSSLLSAGLIALLSFIVLVVYLMISRLNYAGSEEKPTAKWYYWLALIALVLGTLFAKPFLDLSYKTFVKARFPDAMGLSNHMALFTSQLMTTRIVFNIAEILLGILLAVFGPRWWSVIAGLGLAVFGLSGFVTLSRTELGIFDSPFIASHVGFITASTAALFLKNYIAQLAYFAFDLKHRFSAKILIDFIVVIFAQIFGVYTTIALLTELGSLSAAHPYLLGILLGAFLLCALGIYGIHRYFKRGLTAVN